MVLNLNKVVAEYLQANPENKYTARQLAEWVYKTYPAECKIKQERSKASINPLTTDTALIQQVVADIGARRPHLEKKYVNIKTTEGRPRKYYFTLKSDKDEIEVQEPSSTSEDIIAEVVTSSSPIGEHSLYPKLSEFLFSELGVHSKRIDERRSRNARGQNGNKWLYPDLVGMEDLSRDWHCEIKDFVNEYADKKTKLWSFEVKVLINRANVREVFFQTVSNSSWANPKALTGFVRHVRKQIVK